MGNTSVQGSAADGAKIALWLIYERGLKIVNFIHDEIIVESPLDKVAEHEKIMKELMVSGMRQVIKNVKVKTKSSAMLRWYKEAAEDLYDSNGDIVVWEPGMDISAFAA